MFGLNGRQIFILLVLVALLFAGTQYVPAYFAAFQFNDYVRQEVKFAVVNRKTPENIRAIVAKNINAAAVNERADVAKLNAGLQQELAGKGLTFNQPAVAETTAGRCCP